MKASRKVVAQALYELLKGAYPWNYTEKRGALWTVTAPEQQPALFLMKPREVTHQSQAYGIGTHELEFACVVYARRDAVPSEVEPLDFCDDMLDAIDAALGQDVEGPTTLGGLVTHCWVDGETWIDSGALDTQMAMVIPIRVLVGS